MTLTDWQNMNHLAIGNLGVALSHVNDIGRLQAEKKIQHMQSQSRAKIRTIFLFRFTHLHSQVLACSLVEQNLARFQIRLGENHADGLSLALANEANHAWDKSEGEKRKSKSMHEMTQQSMITTEQAKIVEGPVGEFRHKHTRADAHKVRRGGRERERGHGQGPQETITSKLKAWQREKKREKNK